MSGFTSKLGRPKSVPVVKALVAYDCEYTGKTYVMTICNALYFKNMEVNLLPLFMMPLVGIEVNECPKFLSKRPDNNNHSMYFLEEGVREQLQLEGIISYISTRAPTDAKLIEHEGNYLLLTPNLPTWDPHTGSDYRDQEHAMVDYNGHVKEHTRQKINDNVICTVQDKKDDNYDNNQFVASVSESVPAFNYVHQKGRVDALKLSQKLNIPYEMAKKTICVTTQLAVWTVTEPSLTRKFSTNNRML